MKKLLVIFLILVLYSYSAKSTEIIQTPEKEIDSIADWDNIVDYVNSKITLLYIKEQIDNGIIKSKVEKDDFKTFESELGQSDLSNVISFDHLNEILSTNYALTFTNLNVPINNLKNLEDLNSDSLFNEVSRILKERKSDVQNSNKFLELQDSITEMLSENVVPVIVETKEDQKLPDEGQVGNNFISYSALLILAVLFFLTTIFFIVGWLHVRSENNKNMKIIKGHEKALEDKIWELKQATENTSVKNDRAQKTINENLKSGIRKSQNYQNNKNSPKIIPIVDEKSPEITLPIETPEPENRIEHLYAGKPTENRILKGISTQSDPQQTIFKLNILPANNDVAEFEVFHVSDFMTRSITNAPDDYLYRVCNHENTNQEFRKEILTIKKGTANKVDGEWIVKEENKATIKFQ